MKSFVALLVVALALTASAQSGCATIASSIFNTSSFASGSAVSTAFTTACQNCGSGYLLAGAQSSTCTALTGNCMWGNSSSYCLVCQAGYALNSTSNLCVSCGASTASCTWTSGAIASVVCIPGYYLLSGVCLSCSATGGASPTSPSGVAGCSACTLASGASVVVCTACTTSTYGLIASGGTVTTASCGAITSLSWALPGTTTVTGPLTVVAGCIQYSLACTTGPACTVSCLQAAATNGTFCTASGVVSTTAYVCATSVATGTNTFNGGAFTTAGTAFVATTPGIAIPTNCSYGIYLQVSPYTITCQGCTAGGYLLNSACVSAIPGCAVQSTGSACSAAAAGFHLASVGANATTACSNGNPCSSAICGAGLALNISGNCITVTTAISNCLVQNGTSSCAVCAANFATVIGTCGGCPSQCSVCTSATTCASCNTGYQVSNGACSVKSGVSSSAKALFAGLAFISMIFYYIF